MAIRKYHPDIELSPGQWVNVDHLLIHAISGLAAIIKLVKPASVVVDTFVQRSNGEFDDSTNLVKRKTSILFVCDTQEEAFRMHAISREYTREARKAESDLATQLYALKERMTNEALS